MWYNGIIAMEKIVGNMYRVRVRTVLCKKPANLHLTEQVGDIERGEIVQLVAVKVARLNYDDDVTWYQMLSGDNIGWVGFWIEDGRLIKGMSKILFSDNFEDFTAEMALQQQQESQ